jgi:Uncharacterized lipoprotein NlpE involved in copper resistance
MKKTIALFAVLLAGCCGAPTYDSNSAAAPTGTYQGTLPCADCAGIATELTLNANQTFTLKETYLKDSKTLATSAAGRWQRHGNMIELFPSGNSEKDRLCYGISSAKTLTKYDIQCAPIQGTTLDYSLKKQ